MTVSEVRDLRHQLAERDKTIAKLRRMVLDVASTPAGLALLDAATQTTTNRDTPVTIANTP